MIIALLSVLIIQAIILYKLSTYNRQSQLSRAYIVTLIKVMAFRSHDISKITSILKMHFDLSEEINYDSDIPFYDNIYKEVKTTLFSESNNDLGRKCFLKSNWTDEKYSQVYFKNMFADYYQRSQAKDYKEPEIFPVPEVLNEQEIAYISKLKEKLFDKRQTI